MWCVWLDGETVMVGDTMVFTGVGVGVCGFRPRGSVVHFGDDTIMHQLATAAEHKHGCIILTHQPDNTRHDTQPTPVHTR